MGPAAKRAATGPRGALGQRARRGPSHSVARFAGCRSSGGKDPRLTPWATFYRCARWQTGRASSGLTGSRASRRCAVALRLASGVRVDRGLTSPALTVLPLRGSGTALGAAKTRAFQYERWGRRLSGQQRVREELWANGLAEGHRILSPASRAAVHLAARTHGSRRGLRSTAARAGKRGGPRRD